MFCFIILNQVSHEVMKNVFQSGFCFPLHFAGEQNLFKLRLVLKFGLSFYYKRFSCTQYLWFRGKKATEAETDILYSTLTIFLPKVWPWLSSLYWTLLLPCLFEVWTSEQLLLSKKPAWLLLILVKAAETARDTQTCKRQTHTLDKCSSPQLPLHYYIITLIAGTKQYPAA